MIICLGLSLPTGSSGLSRDAAGNRIFCPLFGLAPDGVYMAIPVAWMPVGPYLTFPPLRIKSFLFMRGISLLHFPWSRLHWVLPSTLPCGARTFLVCLTAAAIIWLPYLFCLCNPFRLQNLFYHLFRPSSKLNSSSFSALIIQNSATILTFHDLFPVPHLLYH